MAKGRPWDGGYIRADSKGRETYYIYRKISGRLFEVSTRCHTSRAAHEQLKRFEADPANYKPAGVAQIQDAGIHLSAKLAEEFLRWSKAEKKNSEKWVNDQQRSLAWWSDRLGSSDLRTLKTSRLVEALDDAKTGRKQHIATLKAFCGWLIKVRHVMEKREDPSAGLSVPQARPEQWTTVKAVSLEQLRAVREHLAGTWRDALDVLAGTGWHFNELSRFVAGGSVEVHPMNGARVLACPQTKAGEPLRTEVSAGVAEAATRLRAAGAVDYWALHREFERASTSAGLKEHLRPGHMRHSVATWAINAGAHPAAVAAFLNHKSERTTKRFYATHAVPQKVPTPF
ncbi:tyrosine-type recombinase/integrase [Myxococcus sp. AM011]|uniref:tyrosine-type recombinase/integrase n=1 Tax=Myxococcus sp. AM011 TaxID=2745200 RepID=UPI001595674A|nr:tyrosine-type recombinase/integrase [Myxococcus sp. AM011]NVJ20505.1 tyrosine-type recombinase/integrase [Myxococcus sp. AM011]